MRKTMLSATFGLLILSLFISGCQKDRSAITEETLSTRRGNAHGPLKQTRFYNSDVLIKWLGVQSNMLFRPSGNPFGFNPSRYMAYCGIAAYESVVGGMPGYKSLQGQLTDMPEMPATKPGKSYFWPACAHASLANLTRKFFGAVPSAYNEAAVTQLENELNQQYLEQAGSEVFQRSVALGNQIADLIYAWAQKDNQNWPVVPYQLPPYYAGMFVPVSGAPVNPYWGYNRLLVPGSLNDVIAPPMAYNENPSSPYYKDMLEVYQVSKSLTKDQRRIAKYYNDVNPGMPAGAHYFSILKQVFEQLDPSLEKAVMAYAKTGITFFDASTGSFKAKYDYLTERPIQFIRRVLAPADNPAWQPYLPTPGFPDYPSNHAIFSASVGYALRSVFGNDVNLVNATYDGVMADLGDGPENLGKRYYKNFEDMVNEITISRIYGGIHYRYSCSKGNRQGRKTAMNIDRSLRFR